MSGDDFNALFAPLAERAAIIQFDQDSADLDPGRDRAPRHGVRRPARRLVLPGRVARLAGGPARVQPRALAQARGGGARPHQGQVHRPRPRAGGRAALAGRGVRPARPGVLPLETLARRTSRATPPTSTARRSSPGSTAGCEPRSRWPRAALACCGGQSSSRRSRASRASRRGGAGARPGALVRRLLRRRRRPRASRCPKVAPARPGETSPS